ncbi:MAG TPA: SUF system NifU family Fe-S cluster assembly protein [Candidatus Norongarragalinales archaeon]|nr:SUF system NifU family Fe-S cluster assembly protein [Candidatus Norongarragalinales archaeon]
MDIYRENVLDHYKNPRNFGKMGSPDAKYYDTNPLCGDEIEIQLKISGGKVTEVMFQGQGCAISQASASILTEKLIGMGLADAMKIEKEQITDWLGTELTPSRLKCALLSLMVAKAAINEFEKKG